jgi:hypothetical protein
MVAMGFSLKRYIFYAEDGSEEPGRSVRIPSNRLVVQNYQKIYSCGWNCKSLSPCGQRHS